MKIKCWDGGLSRDGSDAGWKFAVVLLISPQTSFSMFRDEIDRRWTFSYKLWIRHKGSPRDYLLAPSATTTPARFWMNTTAKSWNSTSPCLSSINVILIHYFSQSFCLNIFLSEFYVHFFSRKGLSKKRLFRKASRG